MRIGGWRRASILSVMPNAAPDSGVWFFSFKLELYIMVLVCILCLLFRLETFHIFTGCLYIVSQSLLPVLLLLFIIGLPILLLIYRNYFALK